MWLGGISQNKAALELSAGDLAAAELTLRQGMEKLDSIGELGTGPRRP